MLFAANAHTPLKTFLNTASAFGNCGSALFSSFSTASRIAASSVISTFRCTVPKKRLYLASSSNAFFVSLNPALPSAFAQRSRNFGSSMLVSSKQSLTLSLPTEKIEKVEIRHSNVLAWLLDPEGSHGLGDVALRRVLSNMLLESDADVGGISAAQVELMDFADIEVRREWQNIDVLVIDHRNDLVVLIENKIRSGESKGQLERYRELVGKEFPGSKLVPVFLTLSGSEASEGIGYISYSYAQVLEVVERLLKQRRSQLAEPVGVFLSQYTDTLRRLTMQDEALVDLCKTIYRRHREAIDLIVEYGMAGVGQQVVEDALRMAGHQVLHSSPQWILFMPKSWADFVPENGTAWTHVRRCVSVGAWFSARKMLKVESLAESSSSSGLSARNLSRASF